MNKKKIYPWWFLVLPLVLYVIFFLLPSAMGVGYSFTDWNSRSVLNGTHFVGLQNFKEILTSNKGYLSGIGNTLKFTIISNIVKLIPALMIAIMLQEGLRGKGLYRTLLYLPSILPFVIIGLIFKSILNYNTGLLNTIPKSYYEAAEIDGANFWQRLRYVTLPMLTGSIMINLVFGITYGLKVFDIVYVLTNGGPGHATEVLTTYAFQLYSRGQYGMSSALNTILLIITAIIGVGIVKKMSKQEVQQ